MNPSYLLFRLQSLDSLRLNCMARQAQIQELLACNPALIEAGQQLSLANENLSSCNALVENYQNQINEKKSKRALNQHKLYSGKVNNPKELQDLQADNSSLDKTIAQLEDEQIESMIKAEEVQKASNQAQMHYEHCLVQNSQQNRDLIDENKKLEEKLVQLKQQRQALLPEIPAPLLEHYIDLMNRKNKRAVTEVLDGCCSVCGATLSNVLIQAATSAGEIAHCRGCDRILYRA